MWLETLDCTVNSARAAAENVPWSAMATRAESWRTSICRNDSQHRNVLLARSDAMCVYSQAQDRMRYTPHVPLDGTHHVDPPSTGFRLRGPAPPAGLLPFSRTVAACRNGSADTAARGGGVLRPRPHAARRRVGRGVLGGDAGRPGSCPRRSPARACSTGCSTASARRCRRWRSPARAATLAKGRRGRRWSAAGEAAADGLAAMVQPFAGPIFEQHRAAGRPVVLATTTPYDLVKPLADRLGLDDVVATRYGVDADGTLRRHDRRAVRVGRRQARGGPGVGRRARRRPRRELRLLGQLLRHAAAVAPSARRSSSTPTRGWCSWRRRGAGRSSTSTCRRAS